MNTLELARALNPLSGFMKTGVYASDMTPRKWTRPMAMVVNTDDHTKNGTHWTAIYIDNSGVGWYFDSFGLPPTDSRVLERLRRNCSTWQWNRHQVQSEKSDVCGQFSVFFLYHMFTSGTLASFNDLFTKNLCKNDRSAKSFYGRLLKYLKCNGKSAKSILYQYVNRQNQKCLPRSK